MARSVRQKKIWTAEERAAFRLKMTQARIKKAAERAQQTDSLPLASTIDGGTLQGGPPMGGVDAPLIPPVLEVEVRHEEPPKKPPLSLKDRLFGGSVPPASVPPAAKKAATAKLRKDQDNLVTTVLPTIIASFIATYSRHILPEEYKRCAPSMEECNGVLGPLLAIIGRRVEIIGKASQDVIDATNAIICAFAYSTRAYITYTDIKREGALERAAAAAAAAAAGQPRRGGDTREGVGISRDSTSSNDIGGQYANSGHNGVSSGAEGTRADVRDEAKIVADLLRRDYQGRVKLGLIAG